MNTCTKCGKSFGNLGDLARHENKKFTCIIEERYLCKYCDKKLFNASSLKRHKTICVGQKVLDGQEKIKSMEKNIKQLENTIDDLKKQQKPNQQLNAGNKITNTNINTNNSNNKINDNSIKVNINILPHDKTSYYMENEPVKKIMKKGYKSVPELIKELHFNPDHPENHNVYISNTRDSNVHVFDGVSWNLEDKTAVIDGLYSNSSDYLATRYEELIDELDQPTVTKFGRFKDEMDDVKVVAQVKKDINLTLYNNRKTIEQSKKLQLITLE